MAMRLRALLAVILLAGCTTNPMQARRELFAPVPLNDPATRSAFTDAYAKALTEAQTKPTGVKITAFVDAGNALNARNCGDWLARVTLARRGLVLSDHNLGVVAALTTAIAGLSQWSPTAVAALGAGQVAIQGLSTNLQNDVLGAPSQYQAQATVLGLQATCADQLLIDSPVLTFGAAYARLEACSRVCSYDAAQAAADHALSSTPLTVAPSGALRSAPR